MSDELRTIGELLLVLEEKQKSLAKYDGFTANEINSDNELKSAVGDLYEAINGRNANELNNRSIGVLLRKVIGRVADGRRLGMHEGRYTEFFVCEPNGKQRVWKDDTAL